MLSYVLRSLKWVVLYTGLLLVVHKCAVILDINLPTAIIEFWTALKHLRIIHLLLDLCLFTLRVTIIFFEISFNFVLYLLSVGQQSTYIVSEALGHISPVLHCCFYGFLSFGFEIFSKLILGRGDTLNYVMSWVVWICLCFCCYDLRHNANMRGHRNTPPAENQNDVHEDQQEMNTCTCPTCNDIRLYRFPNIPVGANTIRDVNVQDVRHDVKSNRQLELGTEVEGYEIEDNDYFTTILNRHHSQQQHDRNLKRRGVKIMRNVCNTCNNMLDDEDQETDSDDELSDVNNCLHQQTVNRQRKIPVRIHRNRNDISQFEVLNGDDDKPSTSRHRPLHSYRSQQNKSLHGKKQNNKNKVRIHSSQASNKDTENGSEEDNFYDFRLCTVCMEEERSVATFPCGHTQLCLVCVTQIMCNTKKCPICAATIEDYKTVYL